MKRVKRTRQKVVVNPSPKKVTICASEAKPNQRGQSPRSARGAPLPKARATSKIDLAKPQQADCHLFGARVNITKRNVPVAQMVPIEKKDEELYGKMKGTIHFIDDITKPIEEAW